MDKVFMKDGFKEGLEFALEQLERQSELFGEASMNYEQIKTDILIRDLREVISKAETLINTINNGE